MTEPNLTQPLLRAEDLRVQFPARGSVVGRRQHVQAVRGVTFEVASGESLAIVGESGSGKSTTARALIGLAPIQSGVVHFAGQELTALSKRARRAATRGMQMVFQDPYASLDPLLTVGESIAEPLIIHREVPRNEVRTRVGELLEQVGLTTGHAARQPREFSGGQRQRIAIARALALRPKLLLLDEPVSALDVSTQNQIINLLRDLQRQEGLAYLFISHDLAVVRQIADRVSVMYLGEMVETGTTEGVLAAPGHPYSQALRSAVLDPDPRSRGARGRTVLRGELPSPTNPPAGCTFHPRCPVRMDQCSSIHPSQLFVPHGGTAACLLHDPEVITLTERVPEPTQRTTS